MRHITNVCRSLGTLSDQASTHCPISIDTFVATDTDRLRSNHDGLLIVRQQLVGGPCVRSEPCAIDMYNRTYPAEATRTNTKS